MHNPVLSKKIITYTLYIVHWDGMGVGTTLSKLKVNLRSQTAASGVDSKDVLQYFNFLYNSAWHLVKIEVYPVVFKSTACIVVV